MKDIDLLRNFATMKYNIDDISEYIVWLISDFAKRFRMNEIQAYCYLRQYKGLAFIESFYDVLHTDSFENAVEDVAKYCRRQGGELV